MIPTPPSRLHFADLCAENNLINHNGESSPPAPRHDFLEVNNYLMSGLVVSPIDKWFMGPVPQFSSQDLGVAPGRHDLNKVMARARRVMDDPEQMAWQQVVTSRRTFTKWMILLT